MAVLGLRSHALSHLIVSVPFGWGHRPGTAIKLRPKGQVLNEGVRWQRVPSYREWLQQTRGVLGPWGLGQVSEEGHDSKLGWDAGKEGILRRGDR